MAGCVVALVGAMVSCAPTRGTEPPPRPPGEVGATDSDCLLGSSALGSDCVVTSQQPILQIPGTGSGHVYIADGSVPDENNAWVSDAITLSPSSACGGNTCFSVPAEAGLLPRHSYQWTFMAAAQEASQASRPAVNDPTVTWRGFTIDYVRAGREPTDRFGPLSIGLASGAAQTQVQSQAVQTASGTVQFGLSHRGFYNGTPTGEPWFIEDPAGALPVGWVFTGVDANVPWVRITAVDGVGGSGTRAVTLQAFDGSVLEYTNTGTGGAGWAPPVGVGRPAGAYGSLSQSSDGSTFTWTSGTTIVSFVQSASEPTVWLATRAQEILPGSDTISPGLQVSWDAQGRLATIADQSSVNSSGTATRVAHFYYGGDAQCPTPTASGLVGAPAGMLCAFESLDGTLAQVWYRELSTSFGTHQLGQVVLPGGAVWSFEWQTASITLSDNSQITAPQLLSVQTPSGHDAVSAGTLSTADDSKWWVVYDPFFGAFQGFVSPLPGTGKAANDRISRFYQLASGTNPGQAGTYWGVIGGSVGNFSLSQGAQLQKVGFDPAWRRTSVETFLNGTDSYTVTYDWDVNLDLQTGTSFAGATQTQSYDFLGRPKTLTGPGTNTSTTTYDQGNLAGWIATVYGNTEWTAPGAGSEALNSAVPTWTSAPSGVTGGDFSLQVSTYVAAPAAGSSLAYRVTGDANGKATLWVNGQCDASDTVCAANNTATLTAATAKGAALNLMVQYVRNDTAVSASAPVSIQVEQQLDGGEWTALALADLDPGLNLQSTVASSDTLAINGPAVTLTQTTNWADAVFRTQDGVTYPGFSGTLVTTPSYEPNYDPPASQWKRLTAQTSAGQSTYGLGYWNNTETPSSSTCSTTQGVVQAGQLQTLTYPDEANGQATGLSRRVSYDQAGRKAGLEVLPAGASSGVVGCLSYDARGRKLEGQVAAYSSASTTTGGGAMSKAWAYSPNGLSVTITHTFTDPPEKPACAAENSAPYTCTETQTVDLLGRTVHTTDVWGTVVETEYQLAAATGVGTHTTTVASGAFSATTIVTTNRDSTPATVTRTDTVGSSKLTATWTYDSFGRLQTLETQSAGKEVITATYRYDSQNRVVALTWSRGNTTVLGNTLTLSPNSPRTLGETLTVGGITYDYAYTFTNAGWLTHAALTSRDNSLSETWSLGFSPATLGSNPDAHLNGNVTTQTTTGQTLNLGYDFLDRLQATSATRATAIAHDGLGNLLQYGDLQLSYDQTNQLITADDGTTTVTFERTPDGDLYRKTTAVSGSPTAIRYAAGNLIVDDSGKPTSQTLVLGNLLARVDLATPSDSDFTVSTLQYGNALLKLDSTGAPQNAASPILYGPWGEAIHAPAPDPHQPSYGWQALNRLETNLEDLVLMGERTYLIPLGRFTSLDPAFGGGINPYNYANNDPINNNDPNGELSVIVNYSVIGGVVVVGGGMLVYIFKRQTNPEEVVDRIFQQNQQDDSDDTSQGVLEDSDFDITDFARRDPALDPLDVNLNDININPYKFLKRANNPRASAEPEKVGTIEEGIEEGLEAAELFE